MDNTGNALSDALKTDPQLRERFRDDPKAALSQWLGQPLPDDLEVVAVEDSPQSIHVIIPPDSVTKIDGALSDQELEAVSGGGTRAVTPDFAQDADQEF
ncbi:MAG: nitrile hydratase [Actinomycetota bacterium]